VVLWLLPQCWAQLVHTWRLGYCLNAEHGLRIDGAWATACGLGTPQRTRGTWAALGWEQVALGSGSGLKGSGSGSMTHDQWI
jgi:hypothetical protein